MLRVVCIEDEIEMIELVRLILSKQGYEVIGAEGGIEGVQRVNEALPDIVLLDLMMPDIDGWEVYNQLKATPATRNIPVIIITSRAQNAEKTVALRVAKVDDYIVKPFSPTQLIESIEQAVSKAQRTS